MLSFLAASSFALRPAATPTHRAALVSATTRRELLVAAAASSLSLQVPWAAAAAGNKRAIRPLQPELVSILRVQESTSQQTRLIKTGKFKDLQRQNIKRGIQMMIDNSGVQDSFVAATAYAPPEQVGQATEYGNKVCETLIQIVEYFPDKLEVNKLTNDQLSFILAALAATDRYISAFIELMPAEQVAKAREQIEEENALNMAEFPKDMELLNGPPQLGTA